MLSFINNRQYDGNTTNTGYSTLQNFILQKITCQLDDEYPGIYSTSSSAPSADLIYACKFAPYLGFEHILALANEDGKIALQDTKLNGKSRPVQGFQAHENAIFDLSWNHETWKIITASGDQTCLLLDIGASTVNPVAVFRGHSASIKSVDFCQNSPAIFASGSRDGSVMVWDIRRNYSGNNKAENIIKNAHPVNGGTDVRSSRSKKKVTPTSSTANSVTSVIFQNEYDLISAGAADGNIHLWDLRKNYTLYKGDPLPKFTIPYGSLCARGGVTNLLLDAGKSRLYASCMDDVILEFNAVTYSENPLGIYGGHEQHSFYIKSCLSGDGRYLLSGSSDDHAYIWRVGEGPRPILKLDGHGAEVTCVAWSPADITKIVTCADDVRHRVWRTNNLDEGSESTTQIRGRANVVNPNSPIPKVYGDVRTKLKKKQSSQNLTCRTPRSVLKAARAKADKTPDVTPVTPGPSSERSYSMRTPRSALSPLPENNVLTPNNDSSCGGNRAAASRRLDLSETDYASPTRDLPNYVIDGPSPHTTRVRSSTKRKKLDWLTDLSRKMSPNTQNKMRRIK